MKSNYDAHGNTTTGAGLPHRLKKRHLSLLPPLCSIVLPRYFVATPISIISLSLGRHHQGYYRANATPVSVATAQRHYRTIFHAILPLRSPPRVLPGFVY